MWTLPLILVFPLLWISLLCESTWFVSISSIVYPLIISTRVFSQRFILEKLLMVELSFSMTFVFFWINWKLVWCFMPSGSCLNYLGLRSFLAWLDSFLVHLKLLECSSEMVILRTLLESCFESFKEVLNSLVRSF